MMPDKKAKKLPLYTTNGERFLSLFAFSDRENYAFFGITAPARFFVDALGPDFVLVPSFLGIVMTSGYRHSSHNRHCVRLELEALETRDLPSVSAIELSVPGNQPAATVPLYISGTAITFDQQGLPASLQGNIYIGTQALGPVVGHYQETLTPLRIDGLFIGTLGQATFTFFPGSSADPPLATIHTFDVSLIEGVVPTIGALYVNSAGMITQASGAVADAQGGFASSSLLVLGPPFVSNTWVELTAQ